MTWEVNILDSATGRLVPITRYNDQGKVTGTGNIYNGDDIERLAGKQSGVSSEAQDTAYSLFGFTAASFPTLTGLIAAGSYLLGDEDE